MVPHIIDTVIFVKEGEVKKVYELSLTVKVPTGMIEADLSRPVVEIMDFESGALEYEIYTFGDENVIIPVKSGGGKETTALKKLAGERIMQEIRKFDPHAVVEIVSENKAVVKVDNDVISRLIGKNGIMINEIEKRLGVHIDVEPRIPALGREVDFGINESGNSLELLFDKRLIGKIGSIYIGDNFLFSATVGKKAKIKVTKDSDVGKELINAVHSKKQIKVLI